MNQLFAFALTLIFSVSATAQSKTSREIDRMVGPVHSVTTVSINLVKVEGVWTEGKSTNGPLITYDENGNDGRLGNDSLSPQLEPGSELGSLSGSKFDDKGRLIERDLFGPDNALRMKIRLAYDEAGHVTENSEYSRDGKLQRKHTIVFDDKGNMTSLSSFDGDNKLTRKLTWVFDEKGNQTEWTESQRRGVEMFLFQKISYTYDDKGNILLQIQYGNPEGVVMKQSFSYEFDARGNWIRRERSISYNDSNEPELKDLDLRSITYYQK